MAGLPRRGWHCPSLRPCLQADGASDGSHRHGAVRTGPREGPAVLFVQFTWRDQCPSGPVCAQGAVGCICPHSVCVCVFRGLRRRLCGQQAARSQSGAVTPPWAAPAPAPSAAPVSSAGQSSLPGSCAPTGPGKNHADMVRTGPASAEEDSTGSL